MRYFYTDPLEAAYMAKNFGMEFCQYCNDEDPDSAIYETLNEYTEYHDWPSTWRRFYIDPFSVHLLKPQRGDLLWLSDGDVEDLRKVVSRGDSVLGLSHHSKWESNEFDEDDIAGAKIIQRNGKPFHWPESEPLQTEARA